MDTQINMARRAALQGSVGLAITALAGRTVHATAERSVAEPQPAAVAAMPSGQPGQFDFLTGQWRIRNRRLRGAANDWDEFDGEATCWGILGGVGSVEELRIPARHFSGMGLRLLDVQARVWNDFWVNAKSGVLAVPGLCGHFDNGVGTFMADDKDGDVPIKVRGVWDRITPTSCRWHQSVSRDGGASWAPNWFMDWTRV